MSIVTILDECLEGRGELRIKRLTEERWKKISNVIIWQGSDRFGFAREVIFDDLAWKPLGEKRGLTFSGLSKECEYELKIIALSLYTNGVGEGMPTLKWNTILTGIRSVRMIARELHAHNILAFADLSRLNPFKLRHVLWSIFQNTNTLSKPRLCSAINTSVGWLESYRLLEEACSSLFKELLLPVIEQVSTESRKRHPVIPSGVMKKLISEVNNQIEQIKPLAEKWQIYQQQEIQNIKRGIYCINNGRYQSAKTNWPKLERNLRVLPGLINILVLAFTGMRDGETLALRNDCLTERVSDNDSSYFLTSVLSKTTDGNQKLEWVCGESTSQAVKFLASINAVVHEKAKTILACMSDIISDEYRNELQQGLKENNLFSVGYALSSCHFFRMTKRPITGSFDIKNHFKIRVTQQDIQQLERVSSNYKSISPNSSCRLEPYSEGDYFNFTPHQFRHTFAWFIIANRLGELDDIRYQYKHLWQSMTFVYSQRGFESIGELLNVADSFALELTKKTTKEIFDFSEAGQLAGGGRSE